MADTSLKTRNWAYFVKDDTLYLFEIDGNNNYVAPELSVTDGLKIEYVTGDNVFIDSNGFANDSSPDEDAIVNARDSLVYAVIDYVKGKIAEDIDKDPRMAEFWFTKFRNKYLEGRGAMVASPRIAIPRAPYAIR